VSSLVFAHEDRVVVLKVVGKNGITEDVADLLTVTLTTKVKAQGRFKQVIGAKEVEALLGFEQQKQLLACEDTSCMAQIAGGLGARYVVSSTAGRLGAKYVFHLALLDTQQSVAVGAVSETLSGPDESILAQALDSLVPALLDDAKIAKAGVQPPESEPAAEPEADAVKAAGEGSGKGKAEVREQNKVPQPKEERGKPQSKGNGSKEKKPSKTKAWVYLLGACGQGCLGPLCAVGGVLSFAGAAYAYNFSPWIALPCVCGGVAGLVGACASLTGAGVCTALGVQSLLESSRSGKDDSDNVPIREQAEKHRGGERERVQRVSSGFGY
jgi:hypothetical protein